jgi:hypothetical protein
VVQFTNEARRGTQPNLNVGATTRAFLIYRVGETEVLRVRGSWLDGYDLSRFNVNETHGLIAGVSGNDEFSAVEAVRKAAGGSDRVETRLARIVPLPPKITLLVQLTEADRGSVLYEGEFAISTSPLAIAPLP